eukprot:1195323-Prorocentrum_minimum.AAC.4
MDAQIRVADSSLATHYTCKLSFSLSGIALAKFQNQGQNVGNSKHSYVLKSIKVGFLFGRGEPVRAAV